MLRLATWALLISVVQTAAAEPETTKPQLVRPVLWWSDINRTSDGGGGGIKATTSCIRDAKAFAAEWARLKLKGESPKVDIQDHFVLVLLRADGLDFRMAGGLTRPAEIDGGLSVDSEGIANVVGLPAHVASTNAGWWSYTVAIFSAQGHSECRWRKGARARVEEVGAAGWQNDRFLLHVDRGVGGKRRAYRHAGR